MIKPSLIAAVTMAAFSASSAYAADLTVTIANVTSDAGMIRIALHDGAEGFPSKRQPIQAQILKAQQGSVTAIFAGLKPGQYAVASFHDQNGDGALDTNLVGMPTEPIGMSQDAKSNFGPPSFEDAAFEVGAKNLSIQITLAN